MADRGLYRGEYFVPALFATLGMMVMISASHFLTLYLGLELMSLCLYSLVALNRESAVSSEAAMKYFVLGAIASGLLLYGMSMIYGATGTLEITEVARGAARILQSDHPSKVVLAFGLVFVVSGLAFKVGVVPFHMWNGTTPTLNARPERSEEHTSELQSQSNLVCRLLLEKKK